uniref:Major facilitator superfamily (MFS) profile domain-containing protein n=1 Tax=Caenorhabditis japonica TaxID=281687 RepID=A0A8R1DEW5_CAEJA
MAGGRPAAGCCCFINNVRFPVLLLVTCSVAAMYSTILLFNLTSILDSEVEWRPVPGLDSLHGSSYKGFDRLKRELAELRKFLPKLSDTMNHKKMMRDIQFSHPLKNQTKPTSFRISRGLLYAAPGVGTFLGIFLSMLLSKRFGVRTFFGIFLALAALLTIVFLFVQKTNYYLLLLVRFLQGVVFSGVFPVMGNALVQWGPLKEQLIFLTTMLMFISVGPIVAWPVANYVHALEADMDLVYYVQAIILAFLCVIWSIFYRDRPQTHPWVSGVELNRIVAGKVQELQCNRAHSDSYSSLLKSLSAWSIWTSLFGLFSATAFFVTYLPSLLASPDVFFVQGLGIHGTIPFQLLPISCAIFGSLNLMFKPSTKIIRILNTVAFSIAAILIVSIPFVAFLQTKPGLMSILLLSMIPFGLAIVCGFARSLTVVGRVFAEQIVTMAAIPFGLAFAVVPLMVAFTVGENKLAEWTKVVMFVFFILAAAAVEFAVFGRGRSPSWSESSWDPLVASTKMQSLALIDFNQDECGLYELRRIEPTKK